MKRMRDYEGTTNWNKEEEYEEGRKKEDRREDGENERMDRGKEGEDDSFDKRRF